MSLPDDSARPQDDPPDGHDRRRPSILRLLFTLTPEVTPVAYAVAGFALMALKYGVEALVIHEYTGRFFTPLDFLNPLMSRREEFLAPPAPEWLASAFFIWTLPFLWIAVSMSVRRAAHAGAAGAGLLVLLPVINYATMVVLCFAPAVVAGTPEASRTREPVSTKLRSTLLGIAAGLGITLAAVGVSVYLFEDYGATLFLGTPLVIGVVSAVIYTRAEPTGVGGSVAVAQLSVLLGSAALLLFAFEGVICITMFLPIACIMALFGALLGHWIAVVTDFRYKNAALLVALLPILSGAETMRSDPPLHEVITTIEIDAPPEEVWPHVVGFSDLPEPDPWFFKLGIAYPRRATIEGSGVGAVRRCEFSTGAFVEPITVWDEPRRLAFNVVEQPPPMHELSPYRHVHPPHLDGYLRSKRGEFRLVALPQGRTRLEGSTWYEFDMYPQDYWTLWSDASIHAIHRRVLGHIKRLVEAGGSSR